MQLTEIKDIVKRMHIETLNYDSYTTTDKAGFKHNSDLTNEIFDTLDQYVDQELAIVHDAVSQSADFTQFVFDYDNEKIYLEFIDGGQTFLRELK